MTTDAEAIDAPGVMRFQTRRPLPFWPILFTLFTIVWIAVVASQTISDGPDRKRPEYLVTAAFPFALAVAAWRSRLPMVRGEFADGVLKLEGEGEIPIDRVKAVVAPDYNPKGKRDQKFPIYIHDDHYGMITLPRRLTVPSVHVFQTLISALPPSGSRSINLILSDYLKRNEEGFGADRVYTYVPLKGRMQEFGGRAGVFNFGQSLFATGLLFVATAFLVEEPKSRDMFGGFGAVCLFYGLLTLIVAKFARQSTIRRKHLDSSLVITPLGLALVQEDLRGELIWSQVLDVVYPQKAKHFALARRTITTRALVLKVEGVDISILDIYDRPLGQIHEQIVRYWRPRFDASAFDPTARPGPVWREAEVSDEIDL